MIACPRGLIGAQNGGKVKGKAFYLGNVGSTVVKSTPIPLPPMDVEKDLAAEFETALIKIESLIQDTTKVRAQAWTDFGARSTPPRMWGRPQS